MRPLRTILAVAVCLLPCGSYAQSFCPALSLVAKEANEKFRALRDGEDGIGNYKSKIVLPGATECYVDKDDSSYNCEWQLSFEQDTSAQAKAFATGIKACYPNGKFSNGKSASGEYYFHRFNSVEFYVKADPRRQRVILAIEQDK